jgi:hypothetical protein
MFGSSLPPVVHVLFTLFVVAHIVVSNAYYVVFLFCLSSSCVPYVISFSGLSKFDCVFVILSVTFIYNISWYLSYFYLIRKKQICTIEFY